MSDPDRTLKPLVDAVHEAGALIAIQLFPVFSWGKAMLFRDFAATYR